MITATGLCRFYGTEPNRIKALDHIDLQIGASEKVALLGRSGSGKSTLLNLLAGLDRQSAGQLEVSRKSLADLSTIELAEYRLNTIGVIFQSFQLIPQRTALQNVELPLILAGEPASKRRELASAALERVGLADRVTHFPWQLSGGEQQRVAIARAIVNRPSLLLADEPTGNLDSQTADQITRLLIDVVADNKMTLVLITHDASLADKCADRILQMVDGRLESPMNHRSPNV